MPKNHVSVGRTQYSLWGSMAEAFRAQIDITGDQGREGEAAAERRRMFATRRDKILRAMPPRIRWWLIQCCLELAQRAALIQEDRGSKK